MILHWEQLVLHYGPAISAHRPRFEEAGQTTYGLLCCRYSPIEDQLGYSSGDHAEANLLRSAVWTTHIPNATAPVDAARQPDHRHLGAQPQSLSELHSAAH